MSRPERGLWFRLAVTVLRPLMMLLTKRDWRGHEHVPRSGGVVVCSNHISYFDPLALAHFLFDSGRPPRFLAKASLFQAPLVGLVLRSTGQIPVYRESADAVHAFSAAASAVRRGECIALYPEGTLTKDPGGWPMSAKTGAARIALTTGAPLVPVAQWGAQRVIPPGKRFPRLLPRRKIQVVAGPAVDLASFAGREIDRDVLREAAELVMDAITDLLTRLRHGELPPAVRMNRLDAGAPPAAAALGDPDEPRSA